MRSRREKKEKPKKTPPSCVFLEKLIVIDSNIRQKLEILYKVSTYKQPQQYLIRLPLTLPHIIYPNNIDALVIVLTLIRYSLRNFP